MPIYTLMLASNGYSTGTTLPFPDSKQSKYQPRMPIPHLYRSLYLITLPIMHILPSTVCQDLILLGFIPLHQ